MNPAIRAIGITIALAVLTTAIWLGWPRGAGLSNGIEADATPTSPHGGDTPDTGGTLRAAAAHDPNRESAIASRAHDADRTRTLRLTVTDPQSRPLRGAVLLLNVAGLREWNPALDHVLAVSGQDGGVEVNCAAEAASYWVGCQGFVGERVELPASMDDEEQVVRLHRGSSLLVFCQDVYGEPLANCLISVSRRSIDHEANIDLIGAADRVSIGDPSARIQRSLTGSDGIATVTGLLPGPHTVRCQASDHALLSLSSRGEIQVPGPTIEVRMGPIVAGVWRIVGDELVESGCLFGPEYTINGPMWNDVEASRRRLVEEFQGCAVAVAVQNSPALPEVTVRAYLRNRGLRSMSMRVVPLSALTAAAELDVTHEPGGALEHVQLRVLDRESRVISPEFFSVMVGTSRFDGIVVQPLTDGTLWLPAGEHPLSTSDPWIADRFEPNRVTAPGEIEVRIAASLRCCRFEVRTSANTAIAAYSLQVVAAGREKSYEVVDGRGPRIALPLGSVELRVSSLSFTMRALTVQILSSPWYRRHLEHKRMNEQGLVDLECGQDRARRAYAGTRSGARASWRCRVGAGGSTRTHPD